MPSHHTRKTPLDGEWQEASDQRNPFLVQEVGFRGCNSEVREHHQRLRASVNARKRVSSAICILIQEFLS
jgi:hypothetical protein